MQHKYACHTTKHNKSLNAQQPILCNKKGFFIRLWIKRFINWRMGKYVRSEKQDMYLI